MKPDGVVIVGVCMMLLGGYVLWRAHRKRGNNIDLAYLLVDSAMNPPRVTLAKFTGFVGFLVATWWLTYLTLSDHFDSAAFTAYLAYCGAVKIAGDMVKPKPDIVDDK